MEAPEWHLFHCRSPSVQYSLSILQRNGRHNPLPHRYPPSSRSELCRCKRPRKVLLDSRGHLHPLARSHSVETTDGLMGRSFPPSIPSSLPEDPSPYLQHRVAPQIQRRESVRSNTATGSSSLIPKFRSDP